MRYQPAISFALSSLSHAKCMHARLCIISSLLLSQDLRKAHVLVYANKQDVKGALSASDVSKELALPSVKGHSWHIQVHFELVILDLQA